MKVTIIFESMFGNTEELAEQVRGGLCEAGAEVALVEVGNVTAADVVDLDLLVVAAPTHALTLSRPESRAEAVAKGAKPARALVGIREWLTDVGVYLPAAGRRPAVAVFDTRVDKARHWPGSAAHRATRELRKEDFQVVDRISFYVEGLTGPLVAGEAERARRWGTGLVSLDRGDKTQPSGAA